MEGSVCLLHSFNKNWLGCVARLCYFNTAFKVQAVTFFFFSASHQAFLFFFFFHLPPEGLGILNESDIHVFTHKSYWCQPQLK